MLVLLGIGALGFARWCFGREERKERKEQQKEIQRAESKVRSELDQQRTIVADAKRVAAQLRREAEDRHEAALDAMQEQVRAFRGQALDQKNRFEEGLAWNRMQLRTQALTPQQEDAIHHCMDQLQRGVARLDAYAGPYLSAMEGGIFSAKRALPEGRYETPEMPAAFLPAEFPYAGELFAFEAEELSQYPKVDLGGGQRGRFLSARPRRDSLPERIVGLVKRYDRRAQCWILSEAEGALAWDLREGTAFREPRTVVLGVRRGNRRVAWWRHPGGEVPRMFLSESSLSGALRHAPVGTPFPAYVHRADLLLKSVEIGDHPLDDARHTARRVRCVAGAEFWALYRAVAGFSNHIEIRESSPEEQPSWGETILRLPSGEEFPVRASRCGEALEILPQCDMQVGLAEANGRPLRVYTFCAEFSEPAHGGLSGAEVMAEVRESFEDQARLMRREMEDTLELEKYGAVLRAECERLQSTAQARVAFTSWSMEETGRGGLRGVVRFQTSHPESAGGAVRLCGEEHPVGWTVAGGGPGVGLLVAVLPGRRADFEQNRFPRAGMLECLAVNRDLQNKLAAMSAFRTADAVLHGTPAQQAAVRALRREVLGGFPDSVAAEHPPLPSGPTPASLDAHQQRAVDLLAGDAPLVLIQGPPGTGKTHVIAHGIARILEKNPRARIALVAQSNPAVNEAVSKIEQSFPGLVLYRDLSFSAQEKYAERRGEAALDFRVAQVLDGLQEAAQTGDSALADVRDWLRERAAAQGEDFRREIARLRAVHSQVIACTLSRFAALAARGPLFDLVIVDEAAKASVPETLIAVNGARRLALVGDHNQLLPYLEEGFFNHSAPTAADEAALRELWNHSLFGRLWEQAPAHRKAFLAVMRRSRRPIAECVSRCFYGGTLLPGRGLESSVLDASCALVWLDSGRFVHTHSKDGSVQNEGEARLVVQALREIERVQKRPVSVGVIAFHRAQVTLLQQKLRAHAFSFQPEVLTVDASQGGQWDVVVLSLARTAGGSGFVGSANRLNVALSRARELCVLAGSLSYALHDRTPGSHLAAVARFISVSPPGGAALCSPVFPADRTVEERFFQTCFQLP